MEKLFDIFSKEETKSKEIIKDSEFPNTQKVSINSLKRV